MNTGFIGGSFKVSGVGVAVNQTLGGGAKSGISLYTMYDTEKKQFGIGVSYTQTEYINSTEVTIGPLNISTSKERGLIQDANTIDGASTKKDLIYRKRGERCFYEKYRNN